MHFRDIIDEVIREVSKASKFSEDEVRKVLQTRRERGGVDFVMYLNQISKSPLDDAKELYEAITISKKPGIIKEVKLEATKLSFYINKSLFYEKILRAIKTKGPDFGKNTRGGGKRVIIDFSSPNIAKVFHIGHFRTTIIGSFASNLYRACGYDVVAMNYLGDWGKQFGYVLYGYEKYKSEYNEKEFEANPLMYLYYLYSKANNEGKSNPEVNEKAKEIFRKMEEEKDEKYLSLWRKFRELSIEQYKKLYSSMNIAFDVYTGESQYSDSAKEFVRSNPLCERDEDGSYVIDCQKYGKAIVQKTDGSTLYLTRDIVSAIDRIENYKGDILVYVVATQQNHHFEILFECMKKLGYKAEFKHIRYGMIKGMSTRNGNVHFLEDAVQSLADEIEQRIPEDRKANISDLSKTKRALAVSTLLMTDFNAKREVDYEFLIENRINIIRTPGISIQYTHCRLASIGEKNPGLDLENVDLSLVACDEVFSLAYLLLWYEQVVELCHEDFEPTKVFLYLKEVTRCVNNLVENMKVKGAPLPLAAARYYVLDAARIVIGNSLRLLGREPLNKM